jgi:hypothetical protein
MHAHTCTSINFYSHALCFNRQDEEELEPDEEEGEEDESEPSEES